MHTRVAALAVVLLLLAGCGGGSSNSGMPMPPAPAMGDIVVADDAYTMYVPPGFAEPYTQQLDVLANDRAPAGAALTLVGVGTPSHGTATFQADCVLHPAIIPPQPPVPCVIYSSNVGFVGTDEFTYVVQDASGTATGRITVTVTNHYLLHGCVNVPAGSIGATQVGFAGDDARVAIDSEGCFDLDVDVGSVDANAKLVADAPNVPPSLTARLGAAGEVLPSQAGLDPLTPTHLRLNAFSTAEEAVLDAPADPSQPAYLDGAPIDWPGVFERATLIQLALEAGGVSAGYPSPVAIATQADTRAALRGRFGDAAIAERQQRMLGDGDLVPLMPPPVSPIQVLAFDGDVAAWNGVLLVRLFDGAAARYVTAYGGGDATWQVSGNEIIVAPTSGPASDIGPFGLRLVGNPGDFRFGVALRSTGRLGSQLWNGERAPDLIPSTYTSGFQSAGFAAFYFAAFNETVHRLPVCFLPAGASPPSRAYVCIPLRSDRHRDRLRRRLSSGRKRPCCRCATKTT